MDSSLIENYIFEIKQKRTIIGYNINIPEININQSFLSKDLVDPKFVAEVFFENDINIQKFIKSKIKYMNRKKVPKTNRKNISNLNINLELDKVKKLYNIEKFPTILYNKKILSLDYNHTHWIKYFITECNICHTHINISVSNIEKSSGLCRCCGRILKDPIKITKSQERIGNNIITRYKLISRITTSIDKVSFHLFTCTKYIYDLNIENIDDEIKKYKLYINYLRDKFIKEYNLKYLLQLTEKEFQIVEKNISSKLNNDLTLTIKYDMIDKCNKIKKQLHLFRAKIQGFSINKKNGTKTVLLNEVEYVGIDNFRDHMWTQFSKELDLPIGTTIKFKGEIYDYEREYLGIREVDKNGQAIKIIELLEVDTSTRQRTKLFK